MLLFISRVADFSYDADLNEESIYGLSSTYLLHEAFS